MSIRFEYPKLVLDKMRRVLDDAIAHFPIEAGIRAKTSRSVKDANKDDRTAYVVSKWGLADSYMGGCIKGTYREPSGRVLKNMGIEIWVKDLETGEMQKVDFFGRCEIDHTDPANPFKVDDED